MRMSKEMQTLKDEGYFTKMFLIFPVYHVTSCWCGVLGGGVVFVWGWFIFVRNCMGIIYLRQLPKLGVSQRQLSEGKYPEVNCHRAVFAVYDFIEN